MTKTIRKCWIAIDGKEKMRQSQAHKQPCAVCLFRVGFGIKLTKRFLGIGSTGTAVRFREFAGCSAAKNKRVCGYVKKAPKLKLLRGRPRLSDEAREARRIEANIKAKARYAANPEKFRARVRWANLSQLAIEKRKSDIRNWRAKNPEKDKQYKTKWIANNPNKWAACMRAQRQKPKNKIANNLRNRVRSFLLKGKRIESTSKIIGCSKEFLQSWIEGQWARGMSWENYGEWHIDHLQPCAAFDLTKPDQRVKCFHFSNLRPLWAEDNAEKGDSIVTCQPELLLNLA